MQRHPLANYVGANLKQLNRGKVPVTDTYCVPCAQNGNTSGKDCLYLNVWVPVIPPAKKMLVVVYIHGGAYTGGWASPSGRGFQNVKSVDDLKEKTPSLDSEYYEDILKILAISSKENVQEAITILGYASGEVKQMVTWAENQAASKSPAYLSVFSHGECAGHGADIEYWIGNVMLSGKTDADKELSDKMSDALVAFAKTGNPNTSAVKWPEYTSENPTRMILDNNMTSVSIDKKVYTLLNHPEFILGNIWGAPRGAKK